MGVYESKTEGGGHYTTYTNTNTACVTKVLISPVLYGGNLVVAGIQLHSLQSFASIFYAYTGLEGNIDVSVLIACIVPYGQRQRHIHMFSKVCIATALVVHAGISRVSA